MGRPLILSDARWEIDIYVEPYKPRLRATAIRNIRPFMRKILADALMSQKKKFGGARQSKIE